MEKQFVTKDAARRAHFIAKCHKEMFEADLKRYEERLQDKNIDPLQKAFFEFRAHHTRETIQDLRQQIITLDETYDVEINSCRSIPGDPNPANLPLP